jgi:hypothetical protein
MEKSDTERDKVEAVLIQIGRNQNICNKVCKKLSDENGDLLRFIGRLALQKTLFIKELCSIYELDLSHHLERYSSQSDDEMKDILAEEKEGNPDHEMILDIVTRQENSLLTSYNTLLQDSSSKDELAKMIVRNHMKELSRDLYALRELKEMVVANRSD